MTAYENPSLESDFIMDSDRNNMLKESNVTNWVSIGAKSRYNVSKLRTAQNHILEELSLKGGGGGTQNTLKYYHWFFHIMEFFYGVMVLNWWFRNEIQEKFNGAGFETSFSDGSTKKKNIQLPGKAFFTYTTLL